ncbi:MAG: hypothetical protein R3191_02140, partial [Anaerolineales bacterium]|nr:hypothetical protein [Anaerolineales bacterium]
PKVIELLEEQGMKGLPVLVGGIIPDQDVSDLKEAGVWEVFGPGTNTEKVIEAFRSAVADRASQR